jgi:hypothetical protein
MRIASRCLVLVFAALPAVAALGCGGDDAPYKAQPVWSGKKANIPPPPTLPNTPFKNGEVYTVYGATHHLRSLVHAKEVTTNPITISGYIVESNITTAPACAVHPTGKKDPDTCINIPIPTFTIADNKGDTKGARIKVIGWARNFAVIYDAVKEYDSVKPGEQPKALVKDEMLGADVPYPLPAVGAKVKVTGKYNFSGRTSGDMVADPNYGVMMYQKLETLEPAAEKAAFAKKS